MHIEEKRKGRILVLYLSGQLDNAAAHEFASAIARYLETDERYILVNFAHLTYLSSSGLRILLGTAQQVDARRGKFLLCALAPALMQAIELVGFHKILNIYSTEHEALKHF